MSRLFIVSVALGASLRVFWCVYWPTADTPDSLLYIASAQTMISSGQMATPIYMPLYPLLIAIFGVSGVVWVQIAASIATIGLCGLVAEKISGRSSAASIAAALCALNPVLIYYANVRITETVYTFILVLSVWLLLIQRTSAGSITMVIGILIRPTLDFIGPVIVLLAAQRGTRLKTLLRYAVIYVLLMSPWWLHNYIAYKTFVRLNLGDGITLILENNIEFEQSGSWEAAAAWSKFPETTDPIERNRQMKSAALSYIANRPLQWLSHSAGRLIQFFTPWPAENLPLILKIACILAVLPVYVGVIAAPLGLIARAAPLVLIIVFLTLLHASTHAVMRYRIPIDPLLMAIAGAGIASRFSIAIRSLERNTRKCRSW